MAMRQKISLRLGVKKKIVLQNVRWRMQELYRDEYVRLRLVVGALVMDKLHRHRMHVLACHRVTNNH